MFYRHAISIGMSSTTYETVKFSCPIRGYHFFRNVWQSKQNETLQCDHESNNDYDLFAIYLPTEDDITVRKQTELTDFVFLYTSEIYFLL